MLELATLLSEQAETWVTLLEKTLIVPLPYTCKGTFHNIMAVPYHRTMLLTSLKYMLYLSFCFVFSKTSHC